MLKKRDGFTLIELLIVIVIIGILAAIAIPKFGATREKAYFKSMEADLRNMAGAQEIYYTSNNYTYANTATALGYTFTNGVIPVGMAGSNTGWAATVTHQALNSAAQFCSITFASDSTSGSSAPDCTGD